MLTTTSADHGRQRGAGQRHVRACRRDRRLRAGDQGASRVRRRAGRARDGRARTPVRHRAAARRRARLRPLLPLPAGARPGPRARHASQRRRHQRHVRRRRRPRRRWPGSTSAACATRCRTARSRCRASGAGRATRTTSRRRSTSPAWARGTASPPPRWCSSGFTGVAEVLDGEHNMILALSTQPRPEEMVAGPGHALLRVRNRDQGVLGRLSDPVGARRAAGAAPRAHAHARHRRRASSSGCRKTARASWTATRCRT